MNLELLDTVRKFYIMNLELLDTVALVMTEIINNVGEI